MPLYLKSIDKNFIPAMPGELVFVLGRPGNGKTGFMMRWARERAKQLKEAGQDKRVVVYATFEQSIEEMHAFNVAAEERLSITDMARGEITPAAWKRVLSAGVKRLILPLWFIGHSHERQGKRPRITIQTLETALDAIRQENGQEIDFVCVDYLQRIPPERARDSKTVEVADNVDRLKDLALEVGSPFVVGVQARREVDDREPPIPMMDDGQWSSNIEQAADKIFSLVRPRKYRDEGEMFNKMRVEGHCQMLVSLLKQKLGEDNLSHWVYFDPIYNKLDEMEMREANKAKQYPF